MKKKAYISPQVKVIEFESANILAGSQGGATETFILHISYSSQNVAK